METFRAPPGGDTHHRLDRMEKSLEDRFNRVETGLEKIAQLLERITRVEEHQKAHETLAVKGIERVENKENEIMKRIENLELEIARNSIIAKWTQMIFWVVIIGSSTFVVQHVLKDMLKVPP